MDDIGMSKMILNRLSSALDCLENGTSRISWFYSFGTMLEFIADRTFGLKYDIDVGVFLDECQPDRLINSMQAFGYRFSRQFVNDVTGQPFNMHFKPEKSGPTKDTPEIDVYMFFKRGSDLLYTYDMEDERRETPSRGYVFKTVPYNYICPKAKIVERYLSSAKTEARNILSPRGVWRYWIYDDHGPYTVRIPWAYGTLCDYWYPGWRFRNLYKGQSMSPKLVKVKSCKEL